jgi:hypothetical protein
VHLVGFIIKKFTHIVISGYGSGPLNNAKLGTYDVTFANGAVFPSELPSTATSYIPGIPELYFSVDKGRLNYQCKWFRKSTTVQTMGQGTSIATVSGPSGRANQIP